MSEGHGVKQVWVNEDLTVDVLCFCGRRNERILTPSRGGSFTFGCLDDPAVFPKEEPLSTTAPNPPSRGEDDYIQVIFMPHMIGPLEDWLRQHNAMLFPMPVQSSEPDEIPVYGITPIHMPKDPDA